MARGKARSGIVEVPVAEPLGPAASRARAVEIATILLRHGAPLAALVVLRSSVHTYLLLALFDLGVGYAGHQLRQHGETTTRHALESASTLTERALAWLQLPMMMALAGTLFIFTAMLFLLPFLAAFLWSPLVAAVKADAVAILASIAITSIAGARQFDRVMSTKDAGTRAFLGAAERGAKQAIMLLALFLLMAGHALGYAGPRIGLWVLATLFTAILCAVDIGWKPRWLRVG